MKPVTKEEFKKIKRLTDAGVPKKVIADISERSLTTVVVIEKSKDYAAYDEYRRERVAILNASKEKAKAAKEQKETVVTETPTIQVNEQPSTEDRMINAMYAIVASINSLKEEIKAKKRLF